MSGEPKHGVTRQPGSDADNSPELTTLLRIPDLSAEPVEAIIVPASRPESATSASVATEIGAVLEAGRLVRTARSVKDIATSMFTSDRVVSGKWKYHLATIGTIAAAVIICTLVARTMRREHVEDRLVPKFVSADESGASNDITVEAKPIQLANQDYSITPADPGGFAVPEEAEEPIRQPVSPPSRQPAPAAIDHPERLPRIESPANDSSRQDQQRIDLTQSTRASAASLADMAPIRPPRDVRPTRWDEPVDDAMSTGMGDDDARWGQENSFSSRPLAGSPLTRPLASSPLTRPLASSPLTRPLASSPPTTRYPATNPRVYQTLDEIRASILPRNLQRDTFNSAATSSHDGVIR
jgi:hypothetical protein